MTSGVISLSWLWLVYFTFLITLIRLAWFYSFGIDDFVTLCGNLNYVYTLQIFKTNLPCFTAFLDIDNKNLEVLVFWLFLEENWLYTLQCHLSHRRKKNQSLKILLQISEIERNYKHLQLWAVIIMNSIQNCSILRKYMIRVKKL